jgi:uncharacterized protein YukE
MSQPIRYDHAMIADHVSSQNNLVNHMLDLRQQAINVLNHVAHIWTEHGSNAYQEAHYNVDMAFTKVFETIGVHATAIGGASSTALTTDLGVAAGFRGI